MIKETRTWFRALAAALVAAALTAAQAALPTLTTDHGTYAAGEDIKVAFANGPANAKDWIGLYNADAPVGATTYIAYRYTDGGSGVQPLANGEVTFGSGLPAGNYVAYFMENDGYRVMARDYFSVIEPTAPQVRVSKTAYQQGEAISINFLRGPGNAKDWIGIYQEGRVPGAGSIDYRYVDNTTTGNTPVTDGTIAIPGGIVLPGRYVAYLLENDSYTPIAQESFEVVLRPSPVRIQTDHARYAPGQTVRVTFDGGPGDPQDWIGVYRPFDVPGPVGSTDWRYVNNTQGATVGLSSGEVTFPNGFSAPGIWRVFFLLDDGYSIAAETSFEVIDPVNALVQANKRMFAPNEPITVTFQGASGFAQDWVAIYPSGIIPDGDPGSTVWKYTDNTDVGTAGIIDGTVTFPNGLPAGEWTIFLLENDGYTQLGYETIVVANAGPQSLALLSTTPSDEATNVKASLAEFRAVLENRDTQLNTGSVRVTLNPGGPNERVLAHQIVTDGARNTITAPIGNLLEGNTDYIVRLEYRDNNDQLITNDINFRTGDLVRISFSAPIFFEDFDTTPEGSVPAGWTVSNQSSERTIAADLGHVGSIAYNNFTVVSASRISGPLLTYDNTPEPAPFAQILSDSADTFVVNDALVAQFAVGNVLFGVSGYHGGASQILEAITPSINLSGKTDVRLVFTSLLQQNQDSIAGIEVSVDGGTTWSPVIYYLDPPDIIRTENAINLEATYNTIRTDIATTPLGEGGSYGYFLKAPLNDAVAGATQGRVDNDASDGTRIESIFVPAADNQADVRFRIFYAGTDSWYFAIDNFGVYSATPEARITVTRDGSSITLTWPNLPGYVLQSRTLLTEPNSWTNVDNITGNSYTTTTATAFNRYFRLFKPN